jgi:NAD+ synthase (glutamine-hydrolysing)
LKWGYHDALVQMFTDYRRINPEIILKWYGKGILCEKLGISEHLFKKYHLDESEIFIEDLEWVVKSMQRAVFKRIQSPPIIILSKGAYGYDVRESQLPVSMTVQYKKMREQILKK